MRVKNKKNKKGKRKRKEIRCNFMYCARRGNNKRGVKKRERRSRRIYEKKGKEIRIES